MIGSKQEKLDELKRKFYLSMLDDAVLSKLVLNAFSDMDPAPRMCELPNFMAEPWRPSDKNGDVRLWGTVVTTPIRGYANKSGLLLGVTRQIPVLVISDVSTERTMHQRPREEGSYVDMSDELMSIDVSKKERRMAASKWLALFAEFFYEATSLNAHLQPGQWTFMIDPPFAAVG